MVTKICVGNYRYVGDIYHHAKFYPNRFGGFGSAHAWFRAPKVTRLYFFALEKGYSRDAWTDFDAKYVKRRGSTQRSAFWGSRNQNLSFLPPHFPPKPPFLGPISTERIGVGSSYLVARLDTWLAMNDNCSRSKGQGHKVTHKKLTQSRALALVTLESKRNLINRHRIPIKVV